MIRRTGYMMLLCLCAVLGIAAAALAVRSCFVRDNVSWHANVAVSPGADAPQWLPRERHPARYWARQPSWYWYSEAGVVEVGYYRFDQLVEEESHFWTFDLTPGLNHQPGNPARLGEYWSLAPPTYGFAYLGITRLDGSLPTARVYHRGLAIRLPLPLVAWVALAWPTWRLVRYLRGRHRVEAGFPIEPVVGAAAGKGASPASGDSTGR